MNRCDFSSISTCLKNHISESNQMSQPDFLYELFEDFMDDPANQDIYTLFIQDDSISDEKKKNLTSLYKPASSRLLFLARPSSLHITCYP